MPTKQPRTRLSRLSLLAVRAAIEILGKLLFRLSVDTSAFKPESKTRYLFCANHASYLDGPLLTVILLRYQFVTPLVEDSMNSFPLKHFLNLVQTIYVNRASSSSVLRVGLAALAEKSLLVFPEGTRSQTGQMQVLQSGSAYLSSKSNTVIVPIRISGTHAAWPRGQKFPTPRKIKLLFLPTISPIGKTVRQINEELSQALQFIG